MVKHWTGFGVLEKRNELYEEHILSPLQLEQVQTLQNKKYPVSLIPLLNLKEITVFDTPLDFTTKFPVKTI